METTKKLETDATIKNKEAHNQEASSVSAGGYKGNVAISIRYKNKVIKTIKNHNAGSALLYKFLVYGLMGKYSEVSGSAPGKICLINNTEGPNSSTTEPIDLPGEDTTSNWQAASNFISTNAIATPYGGYDNSANILDATHKNSGITFHFSVPATVISSGPTGDISFNQINLYTEAAKDSITQDTLAYYYIPNGEKWGYIEVTQADRQHGFNLLVDWTLEFGDQLRK